MIRKSKLKLIGLQAILVFSFIKYHPVEYGNEQYPLWADLIGWMMPLSTNLPILIVGVVVVYRSQGNTIIKVILSSKYTSLV